jgi:pSer/pThr/pTyr-binding forkhead associated (FHA) protein
VDIPFPIRTIHVQKGKQPSLEWKESYHHRFQVLAGHRQGESFPLMEKSVMIGRGAECEIDLRDPTISKEHAKIEYKEGDFFIKDQESKHGTFVNGAQITKQKLRSGDEIRIGESLLRFEKIDLG